MNTKTIYQLNQLNQEFYLTIAQDFDRTRQSAWEGWKQLIHVLPKEEPQQVLDIGCGNGRFAAYLLEQKVPFSKYMGFDNNHQLLNLALQKFPDSRVYQWRYLDLVDSLVKDNLSKHLIMTPSLITVFGVMHHIPSYQLRLAFLQQLLTMLPQDALLAVSFWQYHLDDRFKQKAIAWETQAQIDMNELEDNDYLISWNNQPEKPRYVHAFDDQEIDDLEEKLSAKVVKRYLADGKSHQLNCYLLLSSK